jgi:hypothetical protein
MDAPTRHCRLAKEREVYHSQTTAGFLGLLEKTLALYL